MVWEPLVPLKRVCLLPLRFVPTKYRLLCTFGPHGTTLVRGCREKGPTRVETLNEEGKKIMSVPERRLNLSSRMPLLVPGYGVFLSADSYSGERNTGGRPDKVNLYEIVEGKERIAFQDMPSSFWIADIPSPLVMWVELDETHSGRPSRMLVRYTRKDSEHSFSPTQALSWVTWTLELERGMETFTLRERENYLFVFLKKTSPVISRSALVQVYFLRTEPMLVTPVASWEITGMSSWELHPASFKVEIFVKQRIILMETGNRKWLFTFQGQPVPQGKCFEQSPVAQGFCQNADGTRVMVWSDKEIVEYDSDNFIRHAQSQVQNPGERLDTVPGKSSSDCSLL